MSLSRWTVHRNNISFPLTEDNSQVPLKQQKIVYKHKIGNSFKIVDKDEF